MFGQRRYWLRNPSVIATGFVIEKNYIVTNYHVIEDVVRKSANISVYFYETNNKKYTAKLVGYDEVVDIALLKIEGVHPSACICAVDELRIGQEVFSISHFLGIEFSVTSGMISSVHRSDPRFPYIHYVQLQLVQGNGSSGGPVFNSSGKVVSINQSIISMVPVTESTNTGRMLSSVAFSIRADVVNESITRIKKEGKVQLY
jgi:serine protease Do